jgi:ribosomal protein S7
MKRFEIKKKIENHLMRNGEKKTSEKLLLQSLKELQKTSSKQTKNLIKLALTQTTPIFKLQKIENKKQRKKNRKV